MLKVKGGREMVREIQLNIGGMTCVNCEHTIRKKICATDGISRAVVSYSSGTADIAYDDTTISQEQIVAIIEKLGYTVIRHGKKTASQPANVVPTLVIIVALFFLLQSYGILDKLVPGQLAGTGMGYGMLFLTGLFTSVHCIAMCGGINLSQSLFNRGRAVISEVENNILCPGLPITSAGSFPIPRQGLCLDWPACWPEVAPALGFLPFCRAY